jgi:septal ring factor EnvC (AmiA/AmiB activator)
MEKVPENIWYLAGPMFQYNEDVKALARQAGLKIIDANVAVGRANAAEDVPEVTIKSEYLDQGAGERVPTAAELMTARANLLAAHDDLQQRERELAAEKERVAKHAHENELAAARNVEQAAANEAEAQRLRDEAAKQAAVSQVVAAESKPAKAKTT